MRVGIDPGAGVRVRTLLRFHYRVQVTGVRGSASSLNTQMEKKFGWRRQTNLNINTAAKRHNSAEWLGAANTTVA